jgi:hypothetical protein
MPVDPELGRPLWEEAGRQIRPVDAESIVRAGVRARRRRRATTTSAAALSVGVVVATAWLLGPIGPGLVRIADPGPTQTSSGPSDPATEERESEAPEPGDPNYAWPPEGGHSTQMGWWNGPGLPQYEEIASEHDRILVVDTSTMTVVEDNVLTPEFVTRVPSEPVAIDPAWPADSIVVLDADTLAVVGSEPVLETPDQWVYYPIDQARTTPVSAEEAAVWADFVRGYGLTATAVEHHAGREDRHFLYEDGSGLGIWITVTRAESRLPALQGFWDGTATLHPFVVTGLAEAQWARSEYGAAANGVDSSGTCQVMVVHQQLREPITTVTDAQVDTLVTELFPEAAAVACAAG